MNPGPIWRPVAAEALGSAFLLATIVGSGIMAARLAGGNDAVALLCNTLPTGAMLVVLILVFGPASGALSLSAARCPAGFWPGMLRPRSSAQSRAFSPLT